MKKQNPSNWAVKYLIAIFVLTITACTSASAPTANPERLAETMLAQIVAAYTETPSPTLTPSQTLTPSITPSPTQTQTPTNTPTLTHTPTPSPPPPVYVVVLPDALNLREGPGTEYYVAGGVLKGEELLVVGQAYECSWLRVETSDGTSGWVPSSQVNFDQPCEWIATAAIPPTPFIPSPTPTNPGGTKFTVENNTGHTITLTFSGPHSYTFTVHPGKHQVAVFPGQYSIGISCGGGTNVIHGYVSSGYYLVVKSCP